MVTGHGNEEIAMKVYEAKDIRNIAVVGHGGDGKTTLVEAFLSNAGATERRGRVEDGNTTTDYDPEEAKRGISITAAMAPVEWNNTKINFIDAPGFFDFEGEMTQAYYLADSALILANAFSGAGVGAEKAYKYCKKTGKPMAFAVNQIDKEHSDFDKVVGELKDKYGQSVAPFQYPIMDGMKFKGYVDVIEKKAYEFDGLKAKEVAMPAGVAGQVDEYRNALIEEAAGSDEELMEKYFGGEELSKDDILKGVALGIAGVTIVLVFVVSALLNLGVAQLADALVSYFPSADQIGAVIGKAPNGDEVTVERDKNGHFAAQVLKTIADPFVGKINIIKVYRGTLKADTPMFNVNADKSEKSGAVAIMRGKKLINVDALVAGDIGALSKLQYTRTGDSLCSPTDKVMFEPIKFGLPCISLAVGAKKQGDEEKVFSGLHRLEEEDPTFKLVKSVDTGDTLVSGMGEMHIEVICQKLKNKFGVEAQLSMPKVPYKETIRKMAEAEGKHKKQSGGAGQFGVVQMRFEPFDGEFEFVNAIVGGVVPKEFIPAVEKGLKESMVHGVLAGYPMTGVRATLYDGKYHPVDSKEVAFKSAARLAYKAGCAAANPVLLEPIIKADICIPDECMGDIIGDMNRRRGRILGMNPGEDGVQIVTAEVPMSEMVKYATDLRSMTQGRGTFQTEFVRYEEVPANMADKIIEQAKKDQEEA